MVGDTLTTDQLRKWLSDKLSTSADKRYRHRLLTEVASVRDDVIALLRELAREAHEDAKRHLRALAQETLDPLPLETSFDPAEGYPELLPMQTLMGYFGELMAGVVAELFDPNGEHWEVPCFLFRFHQAAFDALERARQSGDPIKLVVGRLGDDCLAFQRNGDRIGKTLVCEAKCLAAHNKDKLADAHEKASEKVPVPVSIRQVIEVLRSSPRPDATEWVRVLRTLWLSSPPPREYVRCDLVMYICGNKPKTAPTWIDRTSPHEEYSGGRLLESVELHLPDVRGLVEAVYKG